MSEEAVQETEGLATPDESQTEQPEPETGKEPEGKPEGEPESPKKGKSTRFSERLQQLTQERDTAFMRGYESAKAESQPLKPEESQAPEPLKTEADFEYDQAKYNAYLHEEISKRARLEARQEAKTYSDELRSEYDAHQRQAQFSRREADFAKEHTDYYDVTRNQGVPFTADMARIVELLPEGPEVTYRIMSDPEIAFGLASLPPALVGAEIGRLSAQMEAEKAKVTKSTTKAPPPPPKVEGTEPGLSVDPTDPDSDNLSMEQWVKAREKQLAKR